MLLYLLSCAVFYSGNTIVKAIIILSLTYFGGFFLITTLNQHSKIQHSATSTSNDNILSNTQTDPATHSPCHKQILGNPSPNVCGHNSNNSVLAHLPEQLDPPSHATETPPLYVFTNINRIASTQPGELLDTLYEEKESPTSLNVTRIGIDNNKKEDHSLPSVNIRSSPIPTPSLSSPPSMRYLRSRSQSHSGSLSVKTDVLTCTPPFDLSPSISSSTTASHLDYSCLTPSTSSSLRQSRRNSRVGQLVQQFETGRFETSSSTPMVSPSTTYTTRITDTIAALHKCQDVPKTPRPSNIDTLPSLCYSPKNLTPSTSTRTIDRRTIGFRPAFTTWEQRISEAKCTVIPSTSMSTPVRSSRTRI